VAYRKKFHLESRERAVEGKRSICANRSNWWCGEMFKM
jgi:hypothetical protein